MSYPSYDPLDTALVINNLAQQVHFYNKKWRADIHTGEPLKRNIGEILMLVVSELAEAMEGDRKGLMDTHLTHRKMFEVELADTIIRVFDIAAGMGLDLGGAYVEKLAYNQTREDHKPENRLKTGGKAY